MRSRLDTLKIGVALAAVNSHPVRHEVNNINVWDERSPQTNSLELHDEGSFNVR